jgi:hypothetical protein
MPASMSLLECVLEMALSEMQAQYGAGQVFPSLDTLAELAHVTRKTAKAGVHALEGRRRIEVDRAQYDGDGRQLSSRYRVLTCASRSRAESTPPRLAATPDQNLCSVKPRSSDQPKAAAADAQARATSRPAAPCPPPAPLAAAALLSSSDPAPELLEIGPELAAVAAKFGPLAARDVAQTLRKQRPAAALARLAFARLLALESADIRKTPGAAFCGFVKLGLDQLAPLASTRGRAPDTPMRRLQRELDDAVQLMDYDRADQVRAELDALLRQARRAS